MSEKLIVSWPEYYRTVEKLLISIDASGYKPDFVGRHMPWRSSND